MVFPALRFMQAQWRFQVKTQTVAFPRHRLVWRSGRGGHSLIVCDAATGACFCAHPAHAELPKLHATCR